MGVEPGSRQELERLVMPDECNNLVPERIISFLFDIGLEVKRREIQQTTFLPGIAIDCGALIVDYSKAVALAQAHCPVT